MSPRKPSTLAAASGRSDVWPRGGKSLCGLSALGRGLARAQTRQTASLSLARSPLPKCQTGITAGHDRAAQSRRAHAAKPCSALQVGVAACGTGRISADQFFRPVEIPNRRLGREVLAWPEAPPSPRSSSLPAPAQRRSNSLVCVGHALMSAATDVRSAIAHRLQHAHECGPETGLPLRHSAASTRGLGSSPARKRRMAQVRLVARQQRGNGATAARVPHQPRFWQASLCRCRTRGILHNSISLASST